MTIECSEILRALEDGSEASEQVRGHLASCRRCRSHASLLSVLATLPPESADEAAVAAIMQALPRPRWQLRRVATWVPAALGALLAAAGLWLLGGVPAAGAVGGRSQSLLSWAFSWALDLAATLRSASDAAVAVVAAGGAWAVVAVLLAGLSSGWLVWALAHRGTGKRG